MKTSKISHLLSSLQRWPSIAVAFSGGVDSAFLLEAAIRAVGREKVLAITAISPSFPQVERENLQKLILEKDFPHRFLSTEELSDPLYCQNDSLRCYYCKRQLFQTMRQYATEQGIAILIEGSNADDAQVWRPGKKALEELQIPSPLQELGFTKREIRECAAQWGLSVAEKPSVPCLATRIQYGISITRELLERIEQAEAHIRQIWDTKESFRVRVHEKELLRLELSPTLFQTFLQTPEKRKGLIDALHRLGFRYLTLDLEGFRSGSFD
ncbi:MAG: ATP-dependent sacrificial sulfur transferase LarE [Planctomycetia bacterium]|nr:ATP-dependent sacrificial sulfur transferase LarE [Planctomycetia bacterium]